MLWVYIIHTYFISLPLNCVMYSVRTSQYISNFLFISLPNILCLHVLKPTIHYLCFSLSFNKLKYEIRAFFMYSYIFCIFLPFEELALVYHFAGLLEMNSLSIFLLVKFLFSLHFWNIFILDIESRLMVSYSTLKMSSDYHVAYIIYDEYSEVILRSCLYVSLSPG